MTDDIEIHIDPSEQQVPEIPDGFDFVHCPRCKTDSIDTGFGMAGGGYGIYYYCANEGCHFFVKEQAEE